VLFAMEEFGELRALVERGFKEEGDVEKAFSLVQRSQGIARTHALAQYAPWPSFLSCTRSVAVLWSSDVARGVDHTTTTQRREHCAKAVETIGQLAPSPYRDALARLTEKVLSRSS
jgi:geranylgeranyl pyrophosphate synthase